MQNRVYVLDTQKLRTDSELFAHWYNKMSEQRRKKIDSFKHQKDKCLSLGAGIAAATAFGSETEPQYIISEHGKPSVKGSKLFFNLSHSGDLAVCALSESSVGADVQIHKHFSSKLIERVFQQREKEYILSAETIEEQASRCTLLWTCKESVLKYLGTGLTLDLKKVLVDAESKTAACEGLVPHRLHLTSFDLQGYELTVCSESERFAYKPDYITL